MTSHTITLDYNHYSMHSILRAVLPPEVTDVPSAFESVGHIAHLNLRENHLPYKEIIGTHCSPNLYFGLHSFILLRAGAA